VRDGVDCAVRAGALADSEMVVPSLSMMAEVTVASLGYLAAHGTPRSPEELGGPEIVGFVSWLAGQPLPLEFTRGGEVLEVALPSQVLVGSADASAAAARLGLSLVQAPRYRFADDLARGALVEVLAEFPPTQTPMSVLYPSRRQLSPRVRLFVDWLLATLEPCFVSGRA
jgi:DNA-binding transcriptional LysR family regulator